MNKLYNFFVSNLIIFLAQSFKVLFLKKAVDPKFDILVVSKDRPFSLQSFLSSAVDHFTVLPTIHVIVNCSSYEYRIRYDRVFEQFGNKIKLNIVYEVSGFKAALVQCFKKISVGFVMLCVDDQVFFRSVDTATLIRNSKDTDIFTLRFGAATSFSYNLDKVIAFPRSTRAIDRTLTWRCELKSSDFNYALSFDSTIISKSILSLMASCLLYKTPNQFEGFMNYSRFANWVCRLKIGCPLKQCAVNVVLNKVQTDNANRSLDFNLDQLNKLFDSGLVVEADPLALDIVNSSHIDYGFVFRELKC